MNETLAAATYKRKLYGIKTKSLALFRCPIEISLRRARRGTKRRNDARSSTRSTRDAQNGRPKEDSRRDRRTAAVDDTERPRTRRTNARGGL